jgi:hypothetical protein
MVASLVYDLLVATSIARANHKINATIKLLLTTMQMRGSDRNALEWLIHLVEQSSISCFGQ